MRLDRQLSLFLFGPLNRCLKRRDTESLPVLMYHSVFDQEERGVKPYYRVVTKPHRFAEHLRLLKESGYTGVSLEEALEMSEAERRQRQPVVITFDDGFADFYHTAWPMLTAIGFTATMFLPTGFVGSPRKSFRGRVCLTWDEVIEMRQSGIRFGSHTVNHRKLYELQWGEIEQETLCSKQELEQRLQEEVSSFSYPFAFPQEDRTFVERFSKTLRRQGYRSCATTVIGRHRSRRGKQLFIPRLPANTADDTELLKAKLNGHYDWMAAAQRWFRQLHRSHRSRRAFRR
jgi:peptidoglycan/xylan/chitin deacetylase (PgdA/CDA1 family)